MLNRSCRYNFEPLGDPELTDAQKQRFIGLVGEMWAEQVNGATIEQRIFPHVLAVAERGWTAAAHFPPHSEMDGAFYAAVEGRLNAMSCTLNRRGIASSPSAPGYCVWGQQLGSV